MEPQDTPPQPPPKPQFSSPSQNPTPPKPQDDEFESAGQSTSDYIKSLEPVKQQQKKRRTKKIIFIIVPLVVVALAAGAYFFIAKPKKTQTPEPAATEHTEHMAPAVDSELSEHYVSQSLRLTVEYPKSWTKNDETSGQLILQSPAQVKLTDATGAQVDGQVSITIVGTGKPVPNFTGTMATAAAESVKMPYTQPAATQRKETYLSFLGFGTSTGVDAVYITGDYGYKKGQDVPKTDVAKIDPMISVSFKGCEGTTCDKPLAISTEAWSTDAILKVTQSILQSLVFQ